METRDLSTVFVVISICIVFAVEIGIQQFTMNPLIQTGVARCLEIFLILTAFWRLSNHWEGIGLSRNRFTSGFKKGLLWSGGFAILSALAGALLYLRGLNPFRLVHVTLPVSASDLIVFYIVGGLIAPVGEEIFFRGIIYQYLRGLFKKKCRSAAVPIAVILSTYLFVAAHQVGTGIPLPQLVGGIVFCISFEMEKSLMTPIVIHSLGNLALFTLSLF